MELGTRQDSGDAESGFGLDLGAGILWQAPERGISGVLRDPLLTHREEDFQEQGLALPFSWEPNLSNHGSSLSLSYAMGATAAGGMDGLLNPTTMEALDADPSSGQRFEAELAYGFPAHNGQLTLTPAVALAPSPTSRNDSLLWSFVPHAEPAQADPWQVSLAGERQGPTSPPRRWTTPSRCASPYFSDPCPSEGKGSQHCLIPVCCWGAAISPRAPGAAFSGMITAQPSRWTIGPFFKAHDLELGFHRLHIRLASPPDQRRGGG